MQWTVIRPCRAGILSAVVLRTNSDQRGLETECARSQPLRMELPLRKLGSGRRSDQCRGSQRCGHTHGRTYRNRMQGCDEQECKDHAAGECPRETSPPPHDTSLTPTRSLPAARILSQEE